MTNKATYYYQIADNALILSHRLAEFSSKAPYLEEDLATTNIALDLLGIAETIYDEIAVQEGLGRSADDLVYRRNESEFVNCQLVEQPNSDFAYIMVRQFFCDAFHFYFFSDLTNSQDDFLAKLSVKSIKQIAYHLRRSSEWMIRLGDGTEEAHEKTQRAIDDLWRYTGAFFEESEVDTAMKESGVGVDLEKLYSQWIEKVNEILYMSGLQIPENKFQLTGGKKGQHTEYLGYILAEMQYLPSKYPDAIW
jgi:ring-1,2-phenylacetyl-CoA epoxidase subunit PaaC